MSKKEKFVLEFDELEEDFFEDASIIAIVCKEEPYHFIWNCNKFLSTNFVLYKGIPKDSILYNFNLYEYFDNKKFIQQYIYCLTNKHTTLLPELKSFDFLWIVKGGDDRLIYIEKMLEQITRIQKLQVVTKIKEDNLKNKTYLII